MWNDILYSKRTSICGVIVAAAVFFRIFFPQQEPLINQLVEALIGLVGAVGLLLAKDGNKSGTAGGTPCLALSNSLGKRDNYGKRIR